MMRFSTLKLWGDMQKEWHGGNSREKEQYEEVLRLWSEKSPIEKPE